MSQAKNILDLDAQSLAAFDPPIICQQPSSYSHGLIFASPHSGRTYPESFLKAAALPLKALRQNEDAYIDDLIKPMTELNIPILLAQFPRCFVDVNRAPDEILPKWTNPSRQASTPRQASTQRAQAGLGVVPTMISDKEAIYKSLPTSDIVQDRLDRLYYPYHDALKDMIKKAKDRSGQALLIDCHSMPAMSVSGRKRADIILGDRFGTSAQAHWVAMIDDHFQTHGYEVARNYPYAGGYVTSHYGQPDKQVNVVQIEVNRALYLNPHTYRCTKGIGALQACFRALAVKLKSEFHQSQIAAAE